MRWYDSDEALRTCLDGLKEQEPGPRAHAVRLAIDCVNRMEPELLDRHVVSFPLPLAGRRWYDDDGPETWLLFHGLERAPKEILQAVTRVLDGERVLAA